MVLTAVVAVSGCTARDMEPPAFAGSQAMGYLMQQVAFGPRVPGTAPWRECRRYLVEHFTRFGLAVDSQVFSFTDPYSGREIPLVNIIASYRGGSADDPVLLLVAHWDTRPRTDHPTDSSLADRPIPGANDGASGVAVLMELARLFKESPPPVNVDLLLTDGEDWGRPGDNQYYLIGSRHFASQPRSTRYAFGIVVDMVGDSDLRIYREALSEQYVKWLNDYVWNTAQRLGLETFVDSVRHTVLDDHVPLNIGGIPTVVLIDFDYRYWHSNLDTPERCAAASLGQVGRLLAEIVYKPSTWPDAP